MKAKLRREIRFVLTGEEIALLMEIDERFSKEFSGRALQGTSYEFTYSYEALYQLRFDVTGAAYFTAPRKLKPRLNRLAKKITRLVKLSDDFSRAVDRARKVRMNSARDRSI